MTSKVTQFAVEARKFLVALGSAVGVALSLGLLSGAAAVWVPGVIAVLGAFVVFYVPNGDHGDDEEYEAKHAA